MPTVLDDLYMPQQERERRHRREDAADQSGAPAAGRFCQRVEEQRRLAEEEAALED